MNMEYKLKFLNFIQGRNCWIAKKIDLLFLDIDMPEIDGIEAGKLFRNKNEDCKIIMLTAQSDRMREAYTEFIVGQRILRSERSLKELETELDGRLFIRID